MNIAQSPRSGRRRQDQAGRCIVRICAGPNDKDAKRIYWYSAKHHVLTMHYCFEATHDRLAAARQWASRSDRTPPRKETSSQREKEINAQLDDLAGRVSAFSGLALHQMERIREISSSWLFVQRAARPQYSEHKLLPDPNGLAHALTPSAAVIMTMPPTITAASRIAVWIWTGMRSTKALRGTRREWRSRRSKAQRPAPAR